jgi:hypothetical protein
MNFGKALQALKEGKRVCREGWNGKGMFVVYQKGYPQGIPCNKQTAEAWGMNEVELFRCEPYLQLQMANGSHCMWQPNTLDILADDWEVIGENPSMDFKEALRLMKEGIPVKLKSWGGYWKWENNSIKMHCKDRRTLDIRETKDVNFTISNILNDQWEIATNENCIIPVE